MLVLPHVQQVEILLKIVAELVLMLIPIASKTVIRRHVHQRHGQPRERDTKREHIVHVHLPGPAVRVTAVRNINVLPDIMAAAVMERQGVPSAQHGLVFIQTVPRQHWHVVPVTPAQQQ